MLNAVTPPFLDTLRTALPNEVFRPVEPRYLEEPRGSYKGQAEIVLSPSTTKEVSTILKACNDAKVPVIPYSGGTGLVGGQLSWEGHPPIILSLDRMNKIRAVYAEENAMIVEAGVILSQVHTAAAEVNRLFPLSLASEGSARIGGLLSTNAGGVNVLRYGNARAQVLGIEAVMPDGQILRGLERLRKDNTGYDLRDLMIGAEGTLGVITAASLRLFPRPTSHAAAFITVPSPSAALSLLSLATEMVGDIISGFELISGVGLGFLAEKLPQIRQPFDAAPRWSALIDIGASGSQDAQALLEEIFLAGHEKGLATDGIIAQSETQRQAFWNVRENMPEANRLIGAVASHDISLPLSHIPEFIEQATIAMDELGPYRINCFGHLGDGNLHFNIFPLPGETKADRIAERPQVHRVIHDLTHKFQGSISAEHGIGRMKRDDLVRYGDPTKIHIMRKIKSAIDPNGIMNPGAVIAEID